MTSPEAIVYGESVRAISAQERALDGLRTRTGTLVAAAALVTAFLGGQALAHVSGLGALPWLAIVGFVALTTLALVVMWPWTWRFAMSARILIQDHLAVEVPTSAEALYLLLAESIEQNWDRNQRKLNALFWCFRAATAALAFEVIMWVLTLTRI